MKLFLVIIITGLSFSLFGDDCREENLATFSYKGQEVLPFKTIGADECDKFGGVYVMTPRLRIILYVNFNLEMELDLFELESSFLEFTPVKYQSFLQGWQLTFISSEVMKTINLDVDARVKMNEYLKTFFVSERVFKEDIPHQFLWRFIYDPEFSWEDI